MHFRHIEMRGYKRPDGFFEIEGHLTDTKTDTFIPEYSDRTVLPGEPIHEMWIRLVFDIDLCIKEAVAVTDWSPYRQCPEAAGVMSKLVGLSIGAGWQAAIRERLGKAESCTHLRELLMPLATAAYQTLAPLRRGRNGNRLDASGRPAKIDTCHTYASGSEQTLLRWPAFYTGDKKSA